MSDEFLVLAVICIILCYLLMKLIQRDSNYAPNPP